MPEPTQTPPETPIPTDQTPTSGNPNPTGNIDTSSQDSLRQAFLAAMQEKTSENESLKKRLEELERNSNKRDPNVDPWQEFTANPQELIQREIQKATEPLNRFVSEMQRREAFVALKAQARIADKALAKILDKAEGYVDQILATAKPELGSVIGACNIVAGMIATGRIQGLSATDLMDTPAPSSSPSNQNGRTLPPTLPPSSSPLPASPEHKDEPWKNMTENERRLARVFGMTDEEYYKQAHQETFVVPNQKEKK